MGFKDLLGKTLTKVEVIDDEQIIFFTSDRGKYIMYHEQVCCEEVTISDINGSFDNLIGTKLNLLDESSNCGDNSLGSYTWTFYRLGSVKGYVDIRWYGESNGYYSESVDFYKYKDYDSSYVEANLTDQYKLDLEFCIENWYQCPLSLEDVVKELVVDGFCNHYEVINENLIEVYNEYEEYHIFNLLLDEDGNIKVEYV